MLLHFHGVPPLIVALLIALSVQEGCRVARPPSRALPDRDVPAVRLRGAGAPTGERGRAGGVPSSARTRSQVRRRQVLAAVVL